ncbi:ABC transporter substrate-binding protein [Georgenia alba]|uniref:ABC transporter substrate-binding protein n=1 Tax=Georgenia alba TaxID=2233858 RepID=A0ABW2QB01_9MICO
MTHLTRAGFLRASGLTLLGGGALAACADDGAGGGQGGATEDFTFVSFLPMDTLTFAPEMVGIAGGHFAAEGLQTTVQVARGTPQALQSVLGGVAPLSRCATIDLATARTEQDQPLVNVGTIIRQPMLRLNYSLDRPIETAEDMVGLTIGIPSEGGTSEKSLLLMLMNGGVDPEQVTRQVVAQTPASWEMVRRGQLDGYISSTDMSLLVQAQHEDAAALNPGDVAPMPSDTQFYVTTEEALESHAEPIRAYLAAVRSACGSVLEDEGFTQTVATLREEYTFATLDDDAVARDGLAVQADGWTDGGAAPELLVTDMDLWLEGLEELERVGFVSGVEDAESWATNELLTP